MQLAELVLQGVVLYYLDVSRAGLLVLGQRRLDQRLLLLSRVLCESLGQALQRGQLIRRVSKPRRLPNEAAKALQLRLLLRRVYALLVVERERLARALRLLLDGREHSEGRACRRCWGLIHLGGHVCERRFDLRPEEFTPVVAVRACDEVLQGAGAGEGGAEAAVSDALCLSVALSLSWVAF